MYTYIHIIIIIIILSWERRVSRLLPEPSESLSPSFINKYLPLSLHIYIYIYICSTYVCVSVWYVYYTYIYIYIYTLFVAAFMYCWFVLLFCSWIVLCFRRPRLQPRVTRAEHRFVYRSCHLSVHVHVPLAMGLEEGGLPEPIYISLSLSLYIYIYICICIYIYIYIYISTLKQASANA